jgi:hypothetical protein
MKKNQAFPSSLATPQKTFRKARLLQASRMRARQRLLDRASISCFAARAGEVCLHASGITQHKLRCGAVHKAPPNPSIERTRPGKPGRASHVKR